MRKLNPSVRDAGEERERGKLAGVARGTDTQLSQQHAFDQSQQYRNKAPQHQRAVMSQTGIDKGLVSGLVSKF